MNEGDIGSAAEQIFRDAALSRARQQTPAKRLGLRPRGSCHWCEEKVAGDQLFCPPNENSCSEDYQRRRAFKTGVRANV